MLLNLDVTTEVTTGVALGVTMGVLLLQSPETNFRRLIATTAETEKVFRNLYNSTSQTSSSARLRVEQIMLVLKSIQSFNITIL